MLSQIDGVFTYPVLTIPDERGMVMKIQNPPFTVQDVYVTTVSRGAIKAWHGYKTKKIYFTCISGKVKFVMWDSRTTTATTYDVIDEMFLCPENNFSILVPPGVYSGFKGLSNEDAQIVVQTNEPYGQIYRKPFDSLNYDWNIKNG